MIVIGAYHGISLLSWKIRRETNSPISHVSIIQLPDEVYNPADGVRINILYHALDTCPVYEAWGVLNPFSREPSGVLKRTGIDEGHTPGTRIELFRIEVPHHIPETQIIADLERIVAAGTKYDWLGLLRYKLRINRDNPDRMICSELLHSVLSNRGVHLIRRRKPSKAAPGDLYISPVLHQLWTVHTGPASKRPQNAPEPLRAPTPAKTDATHLQGHSAEMQGHSAAILADCGLCAANAAASAPDRAANAATITAPGFTILQEDGLFVPFGEFPHDVGIQRFDPEAANALIAELAANPDGVPVYRGHPDVPGMAEDWPDKDAKGWSASAEITQHNGIPGCRFRVKYNDDGLDIIRQAKLKFPSPFWRLKAVGKAANGQRIVAPVALISIGLVNNPNIPVPAVANSGTPKPQPGGQSANEKEIAMREKLIAMLQAASVEVPEGATDEQLLALVQQTISSANEETEEEKQKAAEAVAKAEAEKENAANARKTAAGAIVDLAITQGRLPQAKRDEWLGKFETNFAAANSAIEVLDPIIPVNASRTGNLASRQKGINAEELDAANARKEFLCLVDQEQSRLGTLMGANSRAKVRDMAWESVRRGNAGIYARAYPKAPGK